MTRNTPRISYDAESGALTFVVGRGKSVDSDMRGNAVFDYNRRGEVVRIHLYHHINFEASKRTSRKTGLRPLAAAPHRAFA